MIQEPGAVPGWKYFEYRGEQQRMLFLLAYMESVCLSRGYLAVIPDLSKCRKPKLDDTAALGFQDFDHCIQCLLSYSGIVIAQQTFAVFCNPYLSSILRGDTFCDMNVYRLKRNAFIHPEIYSV